MTPDHSQGTPPQEPPRLPSVAPIAGGVLPAERAMLRAFESQRRLALLRIIVPSLLVVALLATPFAIQADIGGKTFNSTLQLGIGLAGFVIAFVALRRRQVNLASVALLAGVTGVILDLLITDGPVAGSLDINTLAEFQLLLLPIAIAGLFGGALLVLLTTALAMTTTIGIIVMTPHAPALAQLMAQPSGLVVFTVPISIQIVLASLMIAGSAMLRRTLRELSDIRVAHARGQELDRLKDQFIASVNHELRTPIMALQGYVALARELGHRGETERQDHMLRRSTEAADHLARLVKSVLNVRQIEASAGAMELVAFDLRPVIMEATNLLDPVEAGSVERELHMDVDDHLAAYGDRERVRQVLVNLLSNAGKYSPPGSPIEVHARLINVAMPRRRGLGGNQKMIEVTVRDFGAGIPADQVVHLFQRFVRLERDIASRTNGTGLGLAICRTYIQAMGGRIWVESTGEPGDGSRFIFTLPANARVAQATMGPRPL
ncbi:MAG TPA: HAMP domain-containing sensor histidine kinase [Ktedonobacterales bacterium]